MAARNDVRLTVPACSGAIRPGPQTISGRADSPFVERALLPRNGPAEPAPGSGPLSEQSRISVLFRSVLLLRDPVEQRRQAVRPWHPARWCRACASCRRRACPWAGRRASARRRARDSHRTACRAASACSMKSTAAANEGLCHLRAVLPGDRPATQRVRAERMLAGRFAVIGVTAAARPAAPDLRSWSGTRRIRIPGSAGPRRRRAGRPCAICRNVPWHSRPAWSRRASIGALGSSH